VVDWIECLLGIFWAAVIGGSRKQVWFIFLIAGTLTAALLEALSFTKWFLNPGFGPITLLILFIGIAIAITHLSVGLSHKSALKASLTMAILGSGLYFPVQKAFEIENRALVFPGLIVVTIGLAVGVAFIFAKIDRGPTIRTTVIASVIMAIFMLIDKLMHVWKPYMENDAINARPVPTIGQSNALLEPGNFWLTTLDIVMHLILPTIALTAISFAGYIRYSRGTLLEVLNQDYIRTARAKGLTERTVIMRHAFRNTLIPLTTIIVVDIAGIVGGAIITERVFGWKGMGTLFNDAINRFDLNLLMGVFFLTASLAVLANLIADLLYSALDPRIRVNAQ
jgi:peptide/nickel transport system permease protein